MSRGDYYMVNAEIRQAAKDNGVKLWEVADRIGLNDGNFSRKLRHELSPEAKAQVLTAIDEIAASRNG